MSPALAEALAELPQLVRAHLWLSGAALALAVIAGLPLALYAARNERARGPLLGTVGLVQTIPALALLALFYPALLAFGRATRLPVPALGFLPALIALTLYALLPIVRNGVAALATIDSAVLDAADGMGMTRRQRLLLVELPLGAPVLLAGIRTAAIWTIGAATLATTVGQPSLGNLIFSGLQTESWVRVLVGCLVSAALALLVDGLLSLLEQGVARRSPWRIRLGLALLAAALAGAALSSARANPGARQDVLVIGAKNFSEQYILAELLQRRLASAGFRTSRRDDLGSAVAYRALAAGDIDLYVDYAGTLWANVLGRRDTPPPRRMQEELTRALLERDGVRVLGSLGFENAYALAMRRERAAQLGVRTLDDLARVAAGLRMGSDLEFLSRPEWRAVARRYALAFADQRSYSPTFMYRAIANGEVDVIAAFSSDGRIAALDLVTLADPRRALPSYEAVLLLTSSRSGDPKLAGALRPLLDAIPVERMREANFLVDRDRAKRTPTQAAAWLEQQLVANAEARPDAAGR